MDVRRLALRREALTDLTDDDLRAAVGAQEWSTNEFTCPVNTCKTHIQTLCPCTPTDAQTSPR